MVSAGCAASSAASRLRLGSASARPTIDDQLLQIEGLRQIFVGAAFGGLDRGHERVLRAHDDDRQVRPHALDARQELERVVVGHHDVGDDEIAFAGRDPAPQPGDRARRSHFVAGARQRLIEYRPDRRIVVGDENMPGRHSFTPRARRPHSDPLEAASARVAREQFGPEFNSSPVAGRRRPADDACREASARGTSSAAEGIRIRRSRHGRRSAWPQVQVPGQSPRLWS